MTESVEKAADWLDGSGDEPAWPKARPLTHICEGCNTERVIHHPDGSNAFAVVDRFVGQQYSPLVRCEECRVSNSAVPYDNREKP